jgi:LysM repeat protein
MQRFPMRACGVTLELMRLRHILPLAALASLAVPAGAQADSHHVVAPGESLTSVAAADHVSIDALAGANRLTPHALLIAGSVLRIPPAGTGYRSATAAPAPARASASVHRYTVRPGNTLSGVAASARVSTSYLAHLNRISPTAHLIAGATITVPGAAPEATPTTHDYVVRRGDTLTGLAIHAGVSTSYLARLNHISPNALLIAGARLTEPGAGTPAATSTTAMTHAYLVQPGDTLSGVAARSGLDTVELAQLNHISPMAYLIAGATLMIPGAAGSEGGPPYPTAELVTSAQVAQIGAENGVSPALAAAIAWEESGFNNDRVSIADARGVMQILPGTWNWIQDNLTSGISLAPASALDNVRAGVLYIHDLLVATHGNVRLAVAGYVQGLESVRSNGMFAATRQYVSDVLALQQTFGGP